MSRFIKEYKTKRSIAELQKSIDDFLRDEGFEQYSFKKETVYKKGKGFLTSPLFMKFEVKNDRVYLEAWIPIAVWPNVFIGEFGIDGMFLLIPKKMLKAKIAKFEKMIMK
jgi:hypothetical protein